MKFHDVLIPERMKHLRRDRRGYPIPEMVLIDTDDRPHFTINEEPTRQRLLREDRCSICGGKLLRGRWSVGGPASAFHENGAYLDPPLHYECCRYAMQVCPYLAMPSYVRRIDDATLDPSNAPGLLTVLDPTIIQNRPDPFVMVMHVGQDYTLWDWGDIRYIRPKRPHRRYEFWSNGVELSPEEGMHRAEAYMQEMAL